MIKVGNNRVGVKGQSCKDLLVPYPRPLPNHEYRH